MRVVFFGTPEWAVPSLETLVASTHDVAAVITNPDRPAGRGMTSQASPVKRRAAAEGLTVLQPQKASDPEFNAALSSLAPDVAVVVAYGKILPRAVLEVPPLGFVNVHFSLLPAYRGAAPVQRALMDGVTISGVTLIVLTEGMDEGPILSAEEVDIGDDETAGEVGQRLARLGASLLVPTLEGYADGSIAPRPQDHQRATYAPKITTEDARIDWSRPAAALRNQVRALNPEPGAWTILKDKRLKVFAVKQIPRAQLEPGRVDASDALVAGTGEGTVELVDVQPAGKRRMSGRELARGLHLPAGASFE